MVSFNQCLRGRQTSETDPEQQITSSTEKYTLSFDITDCGLLRIAKCTEHYKQWATTTGHVIGRASHYDDLFSSKQVNLSIFGEKRLKK